MKEERQPPLELIYKTNRFSLDSTVLGVSVVTLLAIKHVSGRIDQFVIVMASVGAFYLANRKISDITGYILRTNAHVEDIEKRTLKLGCGTAVFAAVLMVVILLWNVEDILDFVYLLVMISVVVFSIFLVCQAFIVGSGWVNVIEIRRGYMGLYIRVFILIRTVVLYFVWMWFLLGREQYKWFTVILFSVLKLSIIWYVTQDVIETRAIYDENAQRMFEDGQNENDDECTVCWDQMSEPKIMPCKHQFCYQCIYRYFLDASVCPYCREECVAPLGVELADGSVPILVLACVV